ncbi:hypothetical protein MBRA1_000898 [Malassezia brasiliensis]|uniref:protein-tyrosine-phosphatase n=1 Tax=Malassezia brasiliensis TaxID=1821822 RepID=A0AAF0DUD8_9BASI|nr:hypothetical protein MBRA1_000898 [Malassezia brasiliensis]
MHGPVRPRGALTPHLGVSEPLVDTPTSASSSQRVACEITGRELLQRIQHADPWVVPGAAPAPDCIPGPTDPTRTAHGAIRADAAATPRFVVHDDTPVLILDTRPSHIFAGYNTDPTSSDTDASVTAGHLRGSINLQVPTLLLRRTRRLLGGSSAALPRDFSLEAYINTAADAERLEQVRARRYAQLGEHVVRHPHFHALFDVYWFMDVVVLFEESDATPAAAAQRPDSSSYAGRMLLQLLEALQESRAELARNDALLLDERRGLFYVRGGLHAVRQTEGSAAFFSSAAHMEPPAATEVPASFRSAPPYVPTATQGAQRPTPMSFPDAALEARRGSRPSLPRLDTRMSEPTLPHAVCTAPRHSLRPLDLTSVAPNTAPLSARCGGALCNALCSTPSTARAAETEFGVSTVIPGFLYFGPSITCPADVETLRALGVQAVLNTAAEIDDRDAEELALRTHFSRYLRIPLRDVVEQPHVQQSIVQACDFLDRACLYSCPTYVHCRAGKSRSAMIVIAYLIHARRWTLHQAYAHVAAQREQISPNIGFLAELMHFERSTLGTPHSSKPIASPGAAERRPEVVATSLLRRSASVTPCCHRGAASAEARAAPDAAGDAHAELRGTDGRYRVFRAALDQRTSVGKRSSIAALGSPRAQPPPPPQEL